MEAHFCRLFAPLTNQMHRLHVEYQTFQIWRLFRVCLAKKFVLTFK